MKEIKWILAALSVLGIVFLLGVNNCSRKKYAEQQVVVAELTLAKDNLASQVKLRDALIKAKDVKISIVEGNLKLSEIEKEKLNSQFTNLKGQYDNLASSLDNIPPDSSYSILTRFVYVFEGVNRYPFNASQVKAIHLTYLQKLQLGKINSNLLGQVENCESRIVKKDSILTLKNDKITYLNQNINSLDSIINNDTVLLDLKDKQYKKEKRKKGFWRLTAIIVTGVVIGASIR